MCPIIFFLWRLSQSLILGMSSLQVGPLRDCYLHLSATFPIASISILSHIFLASSLLLLFPRSYPGEISWNWMWCQGCCKFPSKMTGCILQQYGCARMGRTDGWTCRTSFSHKCSEHRKHLILFFFFFESWNVFGKYLFQLQTQSNINKWKLRKKILWRTQACVSSCCIWLTIITGATLATG